MRDRDLHSFPTRRSSDLLVSGLVERKVAVINFEGEDGHRGRVMTTCLRSPEVIRWLVGIPTASITAGTPNLHRYQCVANAWVPFFPRQVLHIVQELGRIIPVINVPLPIL